MRPKNIILLPLIALLSFALGWLLNNSQRASEAGTEPKASNIPELISPNFATLISGKFIFKDSECAGFDFISDSSVSWTNEFDCRQDTLKLRWLNKKSFFVQDIKQTNESCPPRVWIYEVESFDGKRLVLKDIWTGWDSHRDELHEFLKESGRN